MGKPKRRRRKSRIKLKQQVRLIEKNDATRVAKQNVLPRMRARPPADVAPTFRLKIRKK